MEPLLSLPCDPPFNLYTPAPPHQASLASSLFQGLLRGSKHPETFIYFYIFIFYYVHLYYIYFIYLFIYILNFYLRSQGILDFLAPFDTIHQRLLLQTLLL